MEDRRHLTCAFRSHRAGPDGFGNFAPEKGRNGCDHQQDGPHEASLCRDRHIGVASRVLESCSGGAAYGRASCDLAAGCGGSLGSKVPGSARRGKGLVDWIDARNPSNFARLMHQDALQIPGWDALTEQWPEIADLRKLYPDVPGGRSSLSPPPDL